MAGGRRLLVKNTLDTRASADESHEWRDWNEAFAHMRVRGHAAIPDSMHKVGDLPGCLSLAAVQASETDPQLVGPVIYAHHADTQDSSSTSTVQGSLHTNCPMSSAVQDLRAHTHKREPHHGSPDVDERGAAYRGDLQGVDASGMDADALGVERGMAGAGLDDAVMDVVMDAVMHKLVSVALERLGLEEMGTAYGAVAHAAHAHGHREEALYEATKLLYVQQQHSEFDATHLAPAHAHTLAYANTDAYKHGAGHMNGHGDGVVGGAHLRASARQAACEADVLSVLGVSASQRNTGAQAGAEARDHQAGAQAGAHAPNRYEAGEADGVYGGSRDALYTEYWHGPDATPSEPSRRRAAGQVRKGTCCCPMRHCMQTSTRRPTRIFPNDMYR